MSHYYQSKPHLPALSRGLASFGRQGDTQLVHMGNREVAGLQALARQHGTSLTRNPHTGLTEAFSLKPYLPIAAGIAGSMFGIPPVWMGLLQGGLTAATTGSLSRGLMSGLLAGGTAGVTDALAGGGGEAVSQGGQAAADSAEQAAINQAYGASPPAPFGEEGDVLNSAAQGGAGAAPTGPTGMDKLSQAGNRAMTGEGLQDVWANHKLPVGAMGAGILGTMAQEQQDAFMRAARERNQASQQHMAPFDPNQRGLPSLQMPWLSPYDYATTGRGAPHYAEGGSVRDSFGVLSALGYTDKAVERFKELERQRQMEVQDRQEGPAGRSRVKMNSGGLVALAQGGSPRYIQGPGDGLSDSVPAQIDGRQPAALADGEVVLPADVVSHIGNGSNKAGAAAIMAHVSHIRKLKTGRAKQPAPLQTTPLPTK